MIKTLIKSRFIEALWYRHVSWWLVRREGKVFVFELGKLQIIVDLRGSIPC